MTIDSGPSGLTNDPTPTFTFSSEPGVSFECSIDTGTPDFGPCSGVGSHTPASPLSDGAHTFRILAMDAAGNHDTATRDFNVDTEAPDSPSLTATVPASPANENSPEIVGLAPEGSTVRIYTTSDCSGSPIVTTTSTELTAGITVSVPDDSSTAFRATSTSTVGNPSACSASITYVEDSTSPQTEIDTDPPSVSGSSSASFTFAGTDAGGSGVASFECRRDGAAFSPCTSPQAYASLADGAHTFEVRAIDTAGNADQSPASFSWSIDTTAPTTNIDSNPTSLTNAGSASFAFSGTDAGGSGVASFECRRDGAAFAPCTSPQAYAALADGAHTFEVRAIDQAGNVDQSPASFSWSIDTTAPTTNIDSSPPALTNAASASFTFSGTDVGGSGVASFECRIDSTQAADWGSCSSPKSYSGLSDGSHKFEVRAIDTAGNVDTTPESFTWTVDTTQVVVKIDSLSHAILGSGQSTELSWHADENGSFSLRVGGIDCDSGSVVDSGPYDSEPAPHVSTVEASDLSEGENTLRICLTGADSSQGEDTTVVRLDTTAPDTQILSNPPTPTSGTAANFTFSGTDAGGSGVASFECRRDGASFAPCTSPQAYAALADGAHSFEVRAIDTAGNVDAAPASFSWSIDTAAPNTNIDSSPPALTNAASASFAFSGSDAGGSGVASFECRRDGASFSPCTSPQAYASLADGAHTFEVRAIDTAGNVDATPASFTWTVDNAAPVVTIDSGPSGLTNDPTPTFTFSSEPGVSFECSIDTGTPNFGPCSGSGTHTPASPLTDGLHTFRVKAKDTAQNETVATRDFQVDTTSPSAPTLNTTDPASPANVNSPRISGSAPAGSTIHLYGNGNCSGPVLSTFPAADLVAGVTVIVPDNSTSTFSATATSSAGSTSSCSSPISYVEDEIAPQTQITNSPPAQSKSDKASIAFTGSDGGGSGVAHFECTIDSGAWTSCSSPVEYSNLADGSHSFEVRATDSANNADDTPAEFEWNVDTSLPPTAPPAPGPIPSAQAQFVRVVCNAKTGTAFLIFRVTGAGRFSTRAAAASEINRRGQRSDARSAARIRQIRLRQRSIRPASTSVVAAGEVKVPIKLTPIGKRLLREEQRLNVRINVSFEASDGPTTTWKLNVTLRKRPSHSLKTQNRGP